MAGRKHVWDFRPLPEDPRYGYCAVCGKDMSNVDGDLRHFTAYRVLRSKGLTVKWIKQAAQRGKIEI